MTENLNDSDDLDTPWAELESALLAFRDALMEMSLSLRDYQFEHDLAGRCSAEDMVQSLSEQITVQAKQAQRP
jgi:hypothetical protein